jgi:23S rRNA (adenine2503-C2)-methyltransferase
MTNLGKDVRERLTAGYRITEGAISGRRISPDGTEKFLIAFTDGEKVETVLIPERNRVTLCVSTASGCARGCEFCATAMMGLKRYLTAGEILEQVTIAGTRRPVSNVVFMGMGEPLDNYDAVRRAIILLAEPKAFGIGARRITVSTSGVVPGIRRMADDGVPARLTVSLGAPEDGLRDRLMPINRKWPLAELAEACEYYRQKTRRAVTIAYVLLRGVNDSPELAGRLAGFAKRIGAKVNLIACNRARGFECPPERDIRRFQEEVMKDGILTLVRRERGGSISGACGQLAVRP